MERPPSQESVTSIPDPLFSKSSETLESETSATEPGLAIADALVRDGHSKRESTGDLPTFLLVQQRTTAVS